MLKSIPRYSMLAWLLAGILSTAQAVEPMTSPNDPRQLQSFTLDNQLQVLLISDPQADQAAAALAVAVGSVDDPPDREGLAHFLEHMLFLGTEKYPEPGEYKRFLASHGGSHNAYTAHDHTNYFFQVDADYLQPALDRFAQFFVAPLFSPRYVDSERRVIHSEYQSKLGNDGWRIRYAQRMAMNPEHPSARFNIGSLETLADREGRKARDELLDFYQERYSANLMRLVVLGREPLPELRDWVETRFAAVDNRGSEVARVAVPLFTPESLPARLDVTPLRDQRHLTLSFPIASQREHYRAKPYRYVAHLIGHEGEGSLLAALKQDGWASSLWAGLSTNHNDEAVFSIGIELTRAGLEQTDAIIEAVFQKIAMIAEQGIDEWRFAELQQLAELSFQFREARSDVSEVRWLAANMLNYPAAEVLRGPYLLADYRPDLIEEVLAALRPDNMLVTVSAPELATDSVEPWFQVPYRLVSLEPDHWTANGLSQSISAQLALPEPNPFLPDSLAIKPPETDTDQPRLLVEQPGLQVWHAQDTEFGVPRAELFVSVRSPLTNQYPEHTVLTELYLRSVREQLNPVLYPAQLAGLNVQLYRHLRGFTLRISGYDAKQAVLLERVLAALRAPELTAERFARVQEHLTDRLRSAQQNPPHRQAASEINRLLLTQSWSEYEQLAALESLSLEDLHAFVPQLLAELEVFALAYGNLHAADTEALAQVVQQHFLTGVTPIEVPRAIPLRLTEQSPALRQLSVPHVDSAAVLYIQGSERSFSEEARFRLLAEMVSSAYFEQLRTEQRLGYIVHAGARSLLEVPGLIFVVQSDHVEPAGLISHTERFLQDYVATLEQLSPEQLQRYQASLRSRILARDTQLRERAEYYWRELDRENRAFDSRQQLADAVAAVTVTDLLTTYRQHLLAEQRRHLVIHALSQEQSDEVGGEPIAQQYIEDTRRFQALLEPFPG